ncbi:response regulator [Phaeovulum sp.]|uniref:response regulator n=1 Tax=Phaeovulum sp. TaxID=2934796 RepID=UPI0039E5B910
MSLTILAVDDSPTIRNLLQHTLMAAGFTLHLAEDGLQGLEMLSDIAPDAIISDINMPRLDGFGFIEAVRRLDRHRATPILVLTTESAVALKTRARTAGATGWIIKPFDPLKLIKALQMVAG